MEYSDLTEKIIGCAFRVYNKLGYGFLESVYEKALLIELKRTDLTVEPQKPVKVIYENELVGDCKINVLV